jgi:hypothetical protein
LAALSLQGDPDEPTYSGTTPDGHTPLQAYSARVKARPADTDPATHYRVRHDRVDAHGKISLRYMSRLYHIGIGRAHKGQQVKLLIADQNIRVITLNGELIRQLTLNPTRDYQPIKSH